MPQKRVTRMIDKTKKLTLMAMDFSLGRQSGIENLPLGGRPKF